MLKKTMKGVFWKKTELRISSKSFWLSRILFVVSSSYNIWLKSLREIMKRTAKKVFLKDHLSKWGPAVTLSKH